MKPRKRKIQTLETLLARTEEYGDCMEWQGYCQCNVPHVQQNDRFMSVRKLIWELLGNESKPKHYYGNKCHNQKCINPAHIVERTHSEHMRMSAKRVDHNAITRIAKLSKAAQKRKLLTDEQVSSILVDQRSTREIASDFNVSRTLVCRIKNGKAHKMVNAKNNPFWGLMA